MLLQATERAEAGDFAQAAELSVAKRDAGLAKASFSDLAKARS